MKIVTTTLVIIEEVPSIPQIPYLSAISDDIHYNCHF